MKSNKGIPMIKPIHSAINSTVNFILELKDLSISQWEVEQKELPPSHSILPQQKLTK